ncbi:MAG TPA: hypothetical protein VF721_06750 [Pyrinomonadaceae bacterium]|jgi:hypothetical protein
MEKKKGQSKKEKQDLENEQLRKEFIKEYADLQKQLGDTFNIRGKVQLERSSIKMFGTEEEFVESRLQESEDKKLKTPTGKYQEGISFTYQQRFVESIRELCPQVLEDLRVLTPYFETLFEKNKENYLRVFDKLRTDLFTYNQFLIEPLPHKPYNLEYRWGELESLLSLISTNYLISVSPDYEQKTSEKLKEFISQNAEFYLKPAEKVIVDAFEKTGKNKESIFVNFWLLQNGVFNWVKQYNLQKDWLIDYAYYFLFQFSNDNSLAIKNLEISTRTFSHLEAPPFEFKFPGWWAGGEAKELYEKRLRDSIEQELKKYFDFAFRYLQLGKRKKATRPIDFQRVKWLVRWTVQNWSKEQILEEIDNEFQQQGIEKYYDINTLDKAFKEFKKYDLPVRK